MTIRTPIVPAGVAAIDTQTIIDEIAAASAGDTIQLGAGTWKLNKAGDNTSSLNLNFAGGGPLVPFSQFFGYTPMWNADDVWPAYLGMLQIVIDKNLVIKGAVDDDGIPITILQTDNYDTASPYTGNAQATGSIVAIAGADMVDGETFTITDYGVSEFSPKWLIEPGWELTNTQHTVVFEFDSNGSVVAGHYPVVFTGIETDEEMAALIAAAIAAAPVDVFVDGVAGAEVSLRMGTMGPGGNIAITDTVTDVDFVVTGFSGVPARVMATKIYTHNGARVRLENLKFYKSFAGVYFGAPFEVVNCRWDTAHHPIYIYQDSRHVYPNFNQYYTQNIAPENMPASAWDNAKTSLIQDCRFDHCEHKIETWGMNSVVITGCHFGKTEYWHDIKPTDINNPSEWMPAFSGAVTAYARELWVERYGRGPTGSLLCMTVCHNDIMANTFVGGGTAFYGSINLFKHVGSDGLVGFNEIYNNTLTDQNHDPDGFFIAWGMWLNSMQLAGIWGDYPYYADQIGPIHYGRVKDNAIYNNRISGMQAYNAGIEVYGGANEWIFPWTSIVSSNLINNNAFLDATPDSFDCVGLFGAQDDTNMIHNDFTATSKLKLSQVDDVFKLCEVMLDTHDCLSQESGMFPPGNGGASENIIDLWGYNNRIVGQPASQVERPAGIGQIKKQVLIKKARIGVSGKIKS